MNSHEVIRQSNEIITLFHETITNFPPNVNSSDKESWIRQLDRHISQCDNILGQRSLKRSLICKLHSTLNQLTLIKSAILRLYDGAGASSSAPSSSSLLTNRVVWDDLISCFQSRVQTGIIINLIHKDLMRFFADAFQLFEEKIIESLNQLNIIKVNTVLCAEFIKPNTSDTDGSEIRDFKYFNTKNQSIDKGTEVKEWFRNNVIDKIFSKLSDFQERDSGWALHKIVSLEVNINKFEIGNGSSFIKLPEKIRNKQACVNVQNYDQACFYWAVVSALFPPNGEPYRILSYPHYTSVLNTDGLNVPITLNHIPKFEKLNNISINVYALEMSVDPQHENFYTVIPVYLTKNKVNKHVNLLVIQNKYYPALKDHDEIPYDEWIAQESTDITYHYCWIKHLSRLLSSQLTKNSRKKFICDRCLNYFSSNDKLQEHQELCSLLNNNKISFPKDRIVKFKNFIHKQTTPFVIYADFESYLEKLSEVISADSRKYQKHVVYNAGYYLKCNFDEYLCFYNSHKGDGCIDWFIQKMIRLSEVIYSKIKNIVPMVVKPDECLSTCCSICEEVFKLNDIIVEDHNHFTGDFRGHAHQACNLNFRKKFMVPIIFHNFSGYDGHFLVKDLARKCRITVLPNNKERYISFTQHIDKNNIKFRYIDSLRFLSSSLDNLVSTLDVNNLKISKRVFSNLDDNKFKLLTRKGVFCYDYIDHPNKLNETALPPIEQFYSKLEGGGITEEKYAHAQTVWRTFEIANLGDYLELYLKTDVLLLADVFENFRQNCYSTHGLDPAWYYTIPGYTWDCMLKYTKCSLELFQDIDMILFTELGIRGGVSVCSARYAEANNKYMSEYDPTKEDKYLLYLDVNNLYGTSMCEPLPYGGFMWLENIDNFDVMLIPDDSPEGYFLQVDLDYPVHLHNYHKDFPFAPEHLEPPNSKQKKLLTTLYNKEKYVIHYRNLKQALLYGVVLKKIHKILKFNQSPWLRSYIELNNNLRTQATTTFEKNLFKLFNNAVFGKTMENIRKHRVLKIVRSWEGRYGAKNLIASSRFHSQTIFDEDLIAIELKKAEIIFNKPLYIGMAILDLSKIVMYDFHYGFMLPKMGIDNCRLMYMDTDSFIYELKCNNVYEEVLKANLEKFDTSDYPPDNPYQIPQGNKKVLGLMKDEANGKIISHFVGLRSKMYSFKVQGGKVTKKIKGIKNNIVKNKISFEDYVECLNEYKTISVTQRTIRSFKHTVFSIEQNKIALSPADDKRYLIPDSYDTLPWGHYTIN